MKQPPRNRSLPPSVAYIKDIAPGARLVRIVDTYIDASGTVTPIFSPTGFNPTRVPNQPTRRGRFSTALRWPRGDWYSYYYAAQSDLDERVALSEFLERRKLPQAPSGGRVVQNSIDVLRDLAFVEVRVARPLNLLDVSNDVYADSVLAEWDVLHGGNFRATREWARYFRNQIPNLDGIFYCPTRIKSIQFGANVVLFGDYDNPATVGTFEDTVRIVPFESDEGRRMLMRLGSALNVVFR